MRHKLKKSNSSNQQNNITVQKTLYRELKPNYDFNIPFQDNEYRNLIAKTEVIANENEFVLTIPLQIWKKENDYYIDHGNSDIFDPNAEYLRKFNHLPQKEDIDNYLNMYVNNYYSP